MESLGITERHVLSSIWLIVEAEARRAELLPLLDGGGEVALDGSEVSKLDTTGLQILVAFCRDLTHRGRTVRWLQVAPALRDAAVLAGVQAELGLPATADVERVD